MPPVTQFYRLKKLEVSLDTDTGRRYSYHTVPMEFDISSVAALRYLTYLKILTSTPEGLGEIHCSSLPRSLQDINLVNLKLYPGENLCLPDARRLRIDCPEFRHEECLAGLPSFLANMPKLKVAAVTHPIYLQRLSFHLSGQV